MVKIVYTVKKAVFRGQEQNFYKVHILQTPLGGLIDSKTKNSSLFVSLLPVAEATSQCMHLTCKHFWSYLFITSTTNCFLVPVSWNCPYITSPLWVCTIHCKKNYGNDCPVSSRVWLVTSRLGKRKSLTFFYSIQCTCMQSTYTFACQLQYIESYWSRYIWFFQVQWSTSKEPFFCFSYL